MLKFVHIIFRHYRLFCFPNSHLEIIAPMVKCLGAEIIKIFCDEQKMKKKEKKKVLARMPVFQLSALPEIVGTFYGTSLNPEKDQSYRRTWREIVMNHCSAEILIVPLPNGEVSKGTKILTVHVRL